MNTSSESVTERINAVLKFASSDKVVDQTKRRPKRKATEMSRKNPVIEDNLDDSDMDKDYKSHSDEASSSDKSGAIFTNSGGRVYVSYHLSNFDWSIKRGLITIAFQAIESSD